MRHQLLGFESDWICVVSDIIKNLYSEKALIEVFLNIEMDALANDTISKINFSLKENYHLRSNDPIYFGLAGAKNKARVFESFANILKRDDYSNLLAVGACVCSSSTLNNGVMLDHNVVISSQSKIGFGVTIKRGALIGHHNSIGDFTDINPGVLTAGGVKIGKGCEIGIGAIIKNNVTIGNNTIIGMGSVVTKDIPAGVIAYGNPCKIVRKNDKWNI